MISALDARLHLPGTLILCSRRLGWRSLLLRRYSEPAAVDEIEIPPSKDALIVLVRSGACRIESFADGRWRQADYRAGDLGMTPPGRASRLRWSGPQPHRTLHLHLPAPVLEDAIRDRAGRSGAAPTFPNRLRSRDPAIASVMEALETAASAGADELYAGSAAHWLITHILHRHAAGTGTGTEDALAGGADGPVLRRVEDYMRARLAEPVTLEDLAAAGGIGTFQLIRAARRAWGETPLKRMTRLRVAHGRDLLTRSARPVIEIALECGYATPSHFAVVFRREYGMSPNAFRRASRA